MLGKLIYELTLPLPDQPRDSEKNRYISCQNFPKDFVSAVVIPKWFGNKPMKTFVCYLHVARSSHHLFLPHLFLLWTFLSARDSRGVSVARYRKCLLKLVQLQWWGPFQGPSSAIYYSSSALLSKYLSLFAKHLPFATHRQPVPDSAPAEWRAA